MAGTEPYHITDQESAYAMWSELDNEGWNVILGAGRPKGPLSPERTYWVEGSKDGETVMVQVGQVAIPRQNRTKFLVMSEEEFSDLQEAIGGQ